MARGEDLSVVTAKDLLAGKATRRAVLTGAGGGVAWLLSGCGGEGESISPTTSASPTTEPGLATLPAAKGTPYALETRGDRLIDPGLATTPDRGLAEVHFRFDPEFSDGSIQQIVVFDRHPPEARVVSYEETPRPGYLVNDRNVADLTHPVTGLGSSDVAVVLFGHGQTSQAASTGMRTYSLAPVVKDDEIVGLQGSFLGVTTLPEKLQLRDK